MEIERLFSNIYNNGLGQLKFRDAILLNPFISN